MQLLPTWDLWYPSSPKHQLASAPALALCTKCWWRVWRNAAIQVPARLLVACLTRKLSLAVYVKNGSHDPILPQICVACPRMPRAKGDTIMHPLSKCRRNRQHAASSKSVWNRSEISLKPINRSRSALSYGFSNYPTRIRKLHLCCFLGLKQVWNSLEPPVPPAIRTRAAT